MPLELGMFLGAKRYGNAAQKEKRLLIFDTEQYRYQKFISDLAGMDIHAHRGDPKKTIGETRDWLVNVSRRELRSSQYLKNIYLKFREQLPAIARNAKLDARRLSYVDYERLLASWLVEA